MLVVPPFVVVLESIGQMVCRVERWLLGLAQRGIAMCVATRLEVKDASALVILSFFL